MKEDFKGYNFISAFCGKKTTQERQQDAQWEKNVAPFLSASTLFPPKKGKVVLLNWDVRRLGVVTPPSSTSAFVLYLSRIIFQFHNFSTKKRKSCTAELGWQKTWGRYTSAFVPYLRPIVLQYNIESTIVWNYETKELRKQRETGQNPYSVALAVVL